MKREITVQDIQQICDTFNQAKGSEDGFILFPSLKGFDVFQINKERLKKYLKLEALYRSLDLKENITVKEAIDGMSKIDPE